MRVGIGAGAAASGGGDALPYESGRIYPLSPLPASSSGTSSVVDFLIPFYPRANVNVDEVAFYRDSAYGGNVYVGIYDAAGALLTDCALDSTTPTGWHAVSTTAVDLTANTLYYVCLNQSNNVAKGQGSNTDGFTSMEQHYAVGVHVNLGASPTFSSTCYSKSRSSAALLSSLTLTGWSAQNTMPIMGVVPT